MLAAWVIAVVLLASTAFFVKGHDVVFYGIAEASETTISMPTAAEIVKVYVNVGQEIHEGDTLVELSRPDLIVRKIELQRELEALQGRGNLNSASIDQKVAEIRADLNTRRNTLNFEIQKLETEYKQNLELASRLKSIATTAKENSNDAMATRIKSLKQELTVIETNAATQIRLLQGSKGQQAKASTNEAESIQQELDRIEKEMKEQTIIANGNWVISSILARDGEKISSFTPILTMTRKEPTQIRGYLHENLYDKISVGDEVLVSSVGNQKKVKAKVLGMSSQIVPFPLRLLKTPELQIYGREVNIIIPENSGFLLGEKVSITEVPEWKSFLKTKVGN